MTAPERTTGVLTHPLIRVAGTLCLLTLPITLPAQVDTVSQQLIGTWALVDAARAGSDENTSRTRGARGLLILDGAGHVFEYFSFGGDGNSTLASVGGFWGRYTTDESNGNIRFESQDGVSPRVHDIAFTRSFELNGDELRLTSSGEPDAQAYVSWTWQRQPIVENLSPTYRSVIGFWQHIEEGQLAEGETELENPRQRAPSVIVYSPSGFVGVHFPTLDREPATEPDDTGLRGYLGYFGTLNVYPGAVSHNILSGVSPTTGSILYRSADIRNEELTVTLSSMRRRGDDEPPRASTIVRLKRLSGAEDMLPPAQ